MRRSDCGPRWRIAVLEAGDAGSLRVLDLEPGLAAAGAILDRSLLALPAQTAMHDRPGAAHYAMGA